MKKENDEIQSRRDFFKKAAKAALPILAIVTLPSILTSCEPDDDGVTSGSSSGCGKCNGSCSGGCDATCRYKCSGGCKTGCLGVRSSTSGHL